MGLYYLEKKIKKDPINYIKFKKKKKRNNIDNSSSILINMLVILLALDKFTSN